MRCKHAINEQGGRCVSSTGAERMLAILDHRTSGQSTSAEEAASAAQANMDQDEGDRFTSGEEATSSTRRTPIRSGAPDSRSWITPSDSNFWRQPGGSALSTVPTQDLAAAATYLISGAPSGGQRASPAWSNRVVHGPREGAATLRIRAPMCTCDAEASTGACKHVIGAQTCA